MNTDTSATNPTTGWFKSTFSNPSQACVEVRFDGDVVHIRDTKDHGAGPVITMPCLEWADLLAEITGDSPARRVGAISIEETADGGMKLHDSATATTLTYTAAECTAFVSGALVGEFDHVVFAEASP